MWPYYGVWLGGGLGMHRESGAVFAMPRFSGMIAPSQRSAGPALAFGGTPPKYCQRSPPTAAYCRVEC